MNLSSLTKMNRSAVVVGCHQPNFLPWLGFFYKIACSDIFILLDDVQFTRGQSKHNWTTRVRIAGSNGPIWLNLPVMRAGAGLQRICDLRTPPEDRKWQSRIIKTLRESYVKTPFFHDVFPSIERVLVQHTGAICATNIALIERIAAMLSLKTTLVQSSSLHVEGASTDRLVNLTSAVGGHIYLSGDGAADYQLDDAFSTAGLSTRKLGFQHPVYVQRKEDDFIRGLSIFDALCNIGIEGTRAAIIGMVNEKRVE